jgi:hypothetical protein
MFTHCTKDALQEEKFGISVVDDWIKDGVLITSNGRKTYKLGKKRDGTQPWVYRFNIAKIIEKLEN